MIKILEYDPFKKVVKILTTCKKWNGMVKISEYSTNMNIASTHVNTTSTWFGY